MEPRGDIESPSFLDPKSLGFMCGLEIHQQLNTGKLHSRMPSQLYDFALSEIPENWQRSHRKLRASQGEGGKVDITARFESRRNRSFVYFQPPNAGLIELDEAPPLEHDDNAVDAVLTMAAMMKAKPISSMQAMRKTVVDGSNTSGFQRFLKTGNVPIGSCAHLKEKEEKSILLLVSNPVETVLLFISNLLMLV